MRDRQQARGVTLTELLVSIGITVSMLLMTSLVFKSSTEASGRAMARGEIMHQLRAITRQLDQDFKGLRPDMPLAIIFEDDPVDPVRQDRLWFFANGDYQANDFNSTSSISGNVAHIFYGQSLDAFNPPTDESSPLLRRILTRREKILTADTGINWLDNTYRNLPLNANNDELVSDFMPMDNFSPFNGILNHWKNEVFASYQGFLFHDNPVVTYSVIRRSQLVDDLVAGTTGLRSFVDGEEGFQRLYVANDVTDFKVDVWFEGATDWFPNATDIDTIQNDPANLDLNDPTYFSFYWNAAEDLGFSMSPPKYSTLITSAPGNLEWRGERGVNELATLLNWTDVWPRALRFTFTLYDKNRRHFPEGETFSYIVKLPKR